MWLVQVVQRRGLREQELPPWLPGRLQIVAVDRVDAVQFDVRTRHSDTSQKGQKSPVRTKKKNMTSILAAAAILAGLHFLIVFYILYMNKYRIFHKKLIIYQNKTFYWCFYWLEYWLLVQGGAVRFVTCLLFTNNLDDLNNNMNARFACRYDPRPGQARHKLG